MNYEGVWALDALHSAVQEVAASRPGLDLYGPAGRIATVAAMAHHRRREDPAITELLAERYDRDVIKERFDPSLLDELPGNY